MSGPIAYISYKEVTGMPSAKKVAAVTELAEKLSQGKSFVVTDYRGLDVKESTELRRLLRGVGGELKVAKNSLARRAADSARVPALSEFLTGPTAIAVGYDDPVALAKVLSEFARLHQDLQIKGGVLAGRSIDAEGVTRLAELPSREVLLSHVLAGMQAPIAGLVGVLQGTVRKLVYVLDAVRAQKEARG